MATAKLLIALIALLPCTVLSLASSAGQRVIYSYAGLTPPDQLFDLTRQGKVGGLILFKENIGDNTASVVADLQKAYLSSPNAVATAPLLIMTDQEGGKVRRISDAGPELSAKKMGIAQDPEAASSHGGNQAVQALKPYGINTNLAPVLDIYREEGNFIDQYERSFGNTSALVSKCVACFIGTQQDGGVVAAAKHFPGLGAAATSENTDESPVTLDTPLEELRSTDMAPYTVAIDAGVKMVMASWAVYPALDTNYPSGLSEKWIQGELRDRLGFKGVTVTDALEALSLKAFGSAENRAVLAAKAGMDLILAAQRNVTQGLVVTNALENAVSDGTLAVDSFEAAGKRIMDLRRTLEF